MKTKAVPSPWFLENGRRLDSRPYLSGAIEARIILEKLPSRKDQLKSVTAGGLDGIYHAGREGRLWVDSPQYGVPFLSSSDILAADLSKLPLISKKQVSRNPRFTIRQGWTLITRSGTIGRTTYARPEMDGLACSEHVMRVVPDCEKIPPGYLYAFISSKFGIPLVIAGTYGSIIQSIEPQHIADLPVPRLGKKLEQQVHDLVQEAADKRTSAATTIRQAAARFDQLIAGIDSHRASPRVTSVNSRSIQKRMEANYHDPIVNAIRERVSRTQHSTVEELCSRIFLPGI